MNQEVIGWLLLVLIVLLALSWIGVLIAFSLLIGRVRRSLGDLEIATHQLREQSGKRNAWLRVAMLAMQWGRMRRITK